MNDMADEKNLNSNDDTDVISELESLSQKYGFEFNADAYKPYSPPINYKPVNPVSEPAKSTARTSEQYHTRPAGVPRMYYDADSPNQTIKLIYGNDAHTGTGPEGRRVIYQEQETESIAEKRMRNRAAAQRSEKGSAGFGSQPYVKHVASSGSAINRDDGDAFRRAYETKKQNQEAAAAPAPVKKEIPRTSARLVAANTETKTRKAPEFHHYELSAGEKAAAFFKSFLPWKGDTAKEISRKLVMDISAILVLFCFGYFVDNYVQHKDKIDKNQQIIEMQTDAGENDLELRWAQIKQKYPDIDFPEGMNIKYAELYAHNQDLVGWLRIDNTNIDTPVVHYIPDREKDPAADDFYLKRNFYKQYDKYGNAYLDPHNTGSELDSNNVIYGHNMTDGLSFAQLEKYYTIEGFKESPIIRYSTLYQDYYFKVYAAFITNGYHSGDNNYIFDYTLTKFTGEVNYGKFIDAIDERKLYDTGVDINTDDKLIILSTCSYEIKQNQMGRLAVVGRLVRPGESTAMDLSLATENPNPRYPQIWYDEHGLTNPYKNAFNWIPE